MTPLPCPQGRRTFGVVALRPSASTGSRACEAAPAPVRLERRAETRRHPVPGRALDSPEALLRPPPDPDSRKDRALLLELRARPPPGWPLRPVPPLRPAGPRTTRPGVPAPGRSLRKITTCDSRVPEASDRPEPSGWQKHGGAPSVTDAAYAIEVEALANERFAAVGGSVLAALAESGLSPRRASNVVCWFIVAQLALGPWRSRGEVRPAGLAQKMGVSRWTEWRARRDAVAAGVVRDWSLPDPEARGYGRGAVRVLELAFVRTRAVTQKVAAQKAGRASRAERRRQERERTRGPRVGADSPNSTRVPAVASEPLTSPPDTPLDFGDLRSPAATQIWTLIERVQDRGPAVGEDAPRPHPPPV